MNDGRIPASTRISASIDEVVVLPWVPETAIVRRSAQIAREKSRPGEHGKVSRPRRDDLDVRVGDRTRSGDDLRVAQVIDVVTDEGAHA